jgi:hypothetical protein
VTRSHSIRPLDNLPTSELASATVELLIDAEQDRAIHAFCWSDSRDSERGWSRSTVNHIWISFR